MYDRKTSSGFTFYHKIGENFYAAYKTRICKKFISIKCKNFRQGCSWTGRVKNISGIEDISDEKYWIGEDNWISLPNHTAKPHTCNPIPFNSLCQNDFRNFVKIKYDEGFHKFSDIRRVSNLDVDLAENYGNLVGDESRFSRVITKKKKQLGVVGHGGYPLEYTKIKIWYFESYFLAEQKFYHRNTDSHFDCFIYFIPVMEKKLVLVEFINFFMTAELN